METKLITFMRKWKTNKGDPMWQCRTSDGEKVNAFVSDSPNRDTFRFFVEADYSAFLNILSEGEQITWNAKPIKVTMQKNGEWWELCGVEMREPDALPDVPYSPVAAFWEGKAIAACQRVINSHTVAIFDCETTGLDMGTAEIVSMGIVFPYYPYPRSRFSIKPSNMSALAATTHIHGITPDDVADEFPFVDYYERLCALLGGFTLVVYNASFDPVMLDLECERAGRDPIEFNRIVDAMQIVSWYFHESSGFGWRPWKIDRSC